MIVLLLLQAQRSNAQTITLRNVNLNSTGWYACEVNTEKPPYKVVKGDAYMEVVGEWPKTTTTSVGKKKKGNLF